jgi:AhpD family alkylhydroperoxidase
MKPRLNYAEAAPGVYDAMDALDQYLGRCGLDRSLMYLVQLRASQINGCAYRLDMHWKDLAWNRLSIAARLVPGGYQPAAAAV